MISKLTDGKATHIPFRDSKLTRLLQSSLSGQGRVSVSCSLSVGMVVKANVFFLIFNVIWMSDNFILLYFAADLYSDSSIEQLRRDS